MKQITILFCLLLFGLSGLTAQGRSSKLPSTQRAPGPAGLYTLSLAPASLVISTLDIAVERPMDERVSLMAHGHFGFRKIRLWESLGGNYISYGGKLECRNYLGKKPKAQYNTLQGPYAAAWFKASLAQVNATLQQKDYTIVKSQSLTPGLSLGWKFSPVRNWPEVTLDLAVGCGYRFGNVNGRYAERSRPVLFKDRGIVPAFTFRVGYTLPGEAKAAAPSPQGSREAAAIAYHDRYNHKQRKAIEKALKRSNCDPGKVNGRFDEQTIRAIKQFQRNHRLSADGMAGPATLKKLLGK